MVNFKEGRIYAVYNQPFARLDIVGVYTMWSGQHGTKTTCKRTPGATNKRCKSEYEAWEFIQGWHLL